MPANDTEAVDFGERACGWLETFFSTHEEAINESRKKQVGVHSQWNLDKAATIASFRLFFMIMSRLLGEKESKPYYLNATLIECIQIDPAFSGLAPLQRVKIMKDNGFVFDVFVWI